MPRRQGPGIALAQDRGSGRRANEDREWVDKVWSVSTIVENAARRERINGRIACEEAREEGRQEGRQEGREEGSARFAALASRLIEAGRVDDLAQAASDPARSRRALPGTGSLKLLIL